MRAYCILIVISLQLVANKLYSQDSTIASNNALSSKYFSQVSGRAAQLEKKLDKKTEKALLQMMELEKRLKEKMLMKDSLNANMIFGNIDQKYKRLREKLEARQSTRQFIPSLDSLATSLKFFEQNQQYLVGIKDGEGKLKDALKEISGLEGQFDKAEEIGKFLAERKSLLKEHLEEFGFAKELKMLSKKVYYYSEQIKEYKALLSDHRKAERKAIELLSKTKVFKDFMRKNSMMAFLFRSPGESNDPAFQLNLAGLQRSAQVNNLIQQQIAAGGQGAQAQFRQNVQDAQGQLNAIKNKMNRFGQMNSTETIPDGFKANNQKTKNLLKRFEYGLNIQTQKATNFFPVTSDIGLSVGYKLNDNSLIGVGASYKMGLGRGWNNIEISSQGLGLRSFIDWKIKGSFWFSGGYERNYKSQIGLMFPANQVSPIGNEINQWQQSGLIGISKIVSLRTRFLKKTKLQLLWDFLANREISHSPALVFRMGYNF